jgi:hypothetical protein
MTTIYNLDKNISGVNGFGLPACDTIYTATLVAITDTAVAVPLTAGIGLPSQTNNKWIAVMQYVRHTADDAVWFAKNAVAAVPAGGNFALSTSEIEPPAKYVQSGDVLHFYCAGVADISVSFYALVES